MQAESLIFDIDGTLWDTRALVAESFTAQMDARGIPHPKMDEAFFTPLFGKIVEEIADDMLPEVPADQRYAIVAECTDNLVDFMKDHPCQVGYPRVAETLEVLSEKHRLFIVSNSQRGYPEMCMDKLGIRKYFSGWLCHGDTGTSKGETIRKLMADYGIENAVYIGDTQGDLEATRVAGIPFIWASYGFGTPEHWDGKIEAFSQLADM